MASICEALSSIHRLFPLPYARGLIQDGEARRLLRPLAAAPSRVPSDAPDLPGIMDDDTARIIGQGRSGTVYRFRDGHGRDVARKVFGSDWLTKLVHYTVFGAPNPYNWCARTVRAAVLRRMILADLVAFWFGPELRVASAFGSRWNPLRASFELHTEWIDGHHAALHHPFTDRREDEARDLHQRIMRPLQRHLAESGFDGLVWQAGRGNPVALNNFLRQGAAGGRWVWIDLESGVPALFPLNPLDLLRVYLPGAWRHGGAMFDDVDPGKLRRYLEDRASALRDRFGEERVSALNERVDDLASCQNPWRSSRRVDRSIRCQLVRGRIDHAQAQWFARHPAAWYGRELLRGLRGAARHTFRLATGTLRWLGSVNFVRGFKNAGAFLFSQRYRASIARDYIAGRIDGWVDRGQLRAAESDLLHDHLESEEAGSYLTDFAIHLAMKPLVKAIEWGLIPALVTMGVLGPAWLPLALTCGGAFARTLYTGGRLIQSALRGRERPWIALFAGLLPVVGNLAFPFQIVYSSAGRDHQLARFIIYDTFSRFGRKLPIWGGPDTLTEHVFNRLPDRFLPTRPEGFAVQKGLFPAALPHYDGEETG